MAAKNVFEVSPSTVWDHSPISQVPLKPEITNQSTYTATIGTSASYLFVTQFRIESEDKPKIIIQKNVSSELCVAPYSVVC